MASVVPLLPVDRKPIPIIQQQHGRVKGRNTSSDASAITKSNGSSVTVNRRTSLSSFPSSRSTSEMSNRQASRSPNPPPIVDTDPISDPSSSSKTPSSDLSSQHSSLSNPPKYHPEAQSRRRLRSQYPRDDGENHVEYILMASFDIDKGPIMEHQYPEAITGDEHMLAELMLPDQAHVRNQDWTIFFLHKDTSQDEEEGEERGGESRRPKKESSPRNIYSNGATKTEQIEELEESGTDSDDEGGEGPPLIYVLNLVNTKQDKSVKRGAVVKAMAICTRHPFLHIYKPLLLLALEDYFKSPTLETLSALYKAVNTMDLSLMPRLTLLEKHLLQASDNKDLFVEKFERMIQMRMAEDRGLDLPVRSSASPNGPNDLIRNGTKAHVQTQSIYSVPRDTHQFETKVIYNGIPVPIKVPVAISPETVGDFSIIKLIQTFSEPHAKSPQPFALHSHLSTGGPHTHPIIVLANGMLTQKRVIFLGHNQPSGEVAEAVLAACALASGSILRGFARHAFPYTDLSKIDDLLKVPGFIAGVTNPTFENHPEWWDILCDLPSGRIKISNKVDPAPFTEGLANFQQHYPVYASATNVPSSIGQAAGDVTGDAAFMAHVLRSIAARHGEGVIRAKWRDWVDRFTRIAAAFEETVYGASALYIGVEEAEAGNEHVSGHGYVWPDEASKLKELAGSASRIEGWRSTRSYFSFKQDLARLYTFRPLKALDLHHLHDRLRLTKVSPNVSRDIYLALTKHTHSYDEICQLLSVAPESHAGLFYIALGLFHVDKKVRMQVLDLLERISEHEAGRHWWKALSRFEKLAFFRIKREVELEMRAKLVGDEQPMPNGRGTLLTQRRS